VIYLPFDIFYLSRHSSNRQFKRLSNWRQESSGSLDEWESHGFSIC